MKTIVRIERSILAHGVYVAELECGHVRYMTARERLQPGSPAKCKGLVRQGKKEKACDEQSVSE